MEHLLQLRRNRVAPPRLRSLRLLSRPRRHSDRTKLKSLPRAMPKIATDAMGGDHAPQAVIEGALLAAQEFPGELILVGEPDAVERELAKHRDAPKFQIIAA